MTPVKGTDKEMVRDEPSEGSEQRWMLEFSPET